MKGNIKTWLDTGFDFDMDMSCRWMSLKCFP